MRTTVEIDLIVQQSLHDLANIFRSGAWKGRREREVVSLFCFGPLLKQVKSNSILYDPTQIGIEVAVPQISSQKRLTGKTASKGQVCKDIVIWRFPMEACWDDRGKPTKHPLCIIEWKHNAHVYSQYDMEWLKEYSSSVGDFVGYAVLSEWPSNYRTIQCSRIESGRVHYDWLIIS